jgi:hypothetical protein
MGGLFFVESSFPERKTRSKPMWIPHVKATLGRFLHSLVEARYDCTGSKSFSFFEHREYRNGQGCRNGLRRDFARSHALRKRLTAALIALEPSLTSTPATAFACEAERIWRDFVIRHAQRTPGHRSNENAARRTRL